MSRQQLSDYHLSQPGGPAALKTMLDIASQVMLTVQPQTAVTTISSAAVLW